MTRALFRISVAAVLVAAGYVAGRLTPEPVAEAAQAGRVFEMRTYTTNEGKLPALETRFRDHTIKFFDKYNMKSIGYWIPSEGPTSQTTLVYILAHPSREEAKANWGEIQRRSRLEEGSHRLGGRRDDPGETAGIRLPEGDRLLADQVTSQATGAPQH